MIRPFFAALLAAAVAFSPMGASTASAQTANTHPNNQLFGLLAGAATLAIIAAAAKHDKKYKEKIATHPQPPRQYHRYDRHHGKALQPRHDHHGRHGRHGRYDAERFHANKKYNRPVSRQIVPASCLREVHTSHGTKRFFAAPCLDQTMRHANRLPRQCAQTYRGYRGYVTGYEPGCLHRYGWQRG